jgi:hypothetical protein
MTQSHITARPILGTSFRMTQSHITARPILGTSFRMTQSLITARPTSLSQSQLPSTVSIQTPPLSHRDSTPTTGLYTLSFTPNCLQFDSTSSYQKSKFWKFEKHQRPVETRPSSSFWAQRQFDEKFPFSLKNCSFPLIIHYFLNTVSFILHYTTLHPSDRDQLLRQPTPISPPFPLDLWPLTQNQHCQSHHHYF